MYGRYPIEIMNETFGPGYFSIRERVHSVQRRENLAVALRWALVSLTAYLSGFLLILVVEHFFRTGTSARMILFWSLHVGLAALILMKVIPPLLISLGVRAGESDHDTARRIGGQFPEIKDHLLNAMQLVADESNQKKYSPDLIAAAFADVLRRTGSMDFHKIVDPSP